MSEKNYTASVAKDLEDLIPTFIRNRAKEVDTLRAALGARDFEQLRQIGHRMKGVGNSYGFEPVTNYGRIIEDAAPSADGATIESCIADYADYLANVKIVYE